MLLSQLKVPVKEAISDRFNILHIPHVTNFCTDNALKTAEELVAGVSDVYFI